MLATSETLVPKLSGVVCPEPSQHSSSATLQQIMVAHLKIQHTVLDQRLVIRTLDQLIDDSDHHLLLLDRLDQSFLQHIILIELFIDQIIIQRLEIIPGVTAHVLIPIAAEFRSLEFRKDGLEVRIERDFGLEDLVQAFLHVADLGLVLAIDAVASVVVQRLGVGWRGSVVEGLGDVVVLERGIDVRPEIALGEEDDELALVVDGRAAVVHLFGFVEIEGDGMCGGDGVELVFAFVTVGINKVFQLVYGAFDVAFWRAG